MDPTEGRQAPAPRSSRWGASWVALSAGQVWASCSQASARPSNACSTAPVQLSLSTSTRGLSRSTPPLFATPGRSQNGGQGGHRGTAETSATHTAASASPLPTPLLLTATWESWMNILAQPQQVHTSASGVGNKSTDGRPHNSLCLTVALPFKYIKINNIIIARCEC